jgi:hypothetical protein
VKLGTKSLLFGAHQCILHPLCLAIAWTRLYGFPGDPRLWLAFLVHDFGYFGCPNMDGPEGKLHVDLGAKIMSIFGEDWGNFTRYHSRSYAGIAGVPPSRLCVADKLATCLVPARLYLLMVNLTGEIHEYMAVSSHTDQQAWYEALCASSRKWVADTVANS